MSRLSRDDIWERYIYHIRNGFLRAFSKKRLEHETAVCPVCQKNTMHKNQTPHDWERGHIISVSRGGPDVWINLIPICIKCNKAMGSNSVFQYLVTIGKLDAPTANILEQEHKKMLIEYDPKCRLCANRKCYYSDDYCRKCYNNIVIVPMEID